MSLHMGHGCPIIVLMTKRELLITEIEAFCSAKGLSEREFSELALGHPKFFARLQRDAVTSKSMGAADHFLTGHADTTRDVLRSRLEGQRSKARSELRVAA